MFNNLQALGIGIIGFAIIIGVGVVVLGKVTESVACGLPRVYNTTDNLCYNATGGDPIATNTAGTNTFYMGTQLGTTGLAGWTPAIIALSVGLLFLGAFLTKKRGY